MIEILVDPLKTSSRALCETGSGHIKKLLARGWKTLDRLDKTSLISLKKDLKLDLGAAAKEETMARAIRERLLTPPRKE